MDNNIICKVCSKSFPDDTALHHHLKAHKLRQAEYYQKYYPRFDRYDNNIIKFKNKEQYFSAIFNSKKNLKCWLSCVTPRLAQSYIEQYFIQRRDSGKLRYVPTQVELKTMMVPGIKYITEKFGNYTEFCVNLGLNTRFFNHKLDEKKFNDISNKVIFTDSREQRPLELDNTQRIEGLSFGDYRMKDSEIYIERKSVSDAWGTLTGGFNRFEKEIVRAKEAGAYLVILVEATFSELEKFPNERQVYGKIKIPVEFVHHNIRFLLQKYDHIQFLFVNNRQEACRIVQKIFSAGNQVKDVDLQYQYDIGKL